MIKLKNVTKRFHIHDELIQKNDQVRDGFFYALDDVSLTIENSDCIIISGANGSGKSILMYLIAGLEDPTSGTVETSSKPGLIFQEPDAQILGETPREDIAFGPRNAKKKLKKDEIRARVNDALLQTGLSEKADFPARSLSGGEKRRLATAGVLAMHAEIIIFDEPYANMDYQGVVQINRLIQKLKKDGKTIIILTHELEKCLALAERFIVLNKGKKVFDGKTIDVLSCNLEEWGIHHPLKKNVNKLEDLLW